MSEGSNSQVVAASASRTALRRAGRSTSPRLRPRAWPASGPARSSPARQDRLERGDELLDQLLLGVWRTASLRAAAAGARPHAPLRGVLGRLTVVRHRPVVPAGEPAPWTDCDTPAELARARTTAAGRLPGPAAG